MYIQHHLQQSKELINEIKTIAKQIHRFCLFKSQKANYSWTPQQELRHLVQVRHFLSHLFNCTFSKHGANHNYWISIPLSNPDIKKRFDLLFHTQYTKKHYLARGCKGIMSLKDAKALNMILKIKHGCNTTSQCTKFKFHDDILELFKDIMLKYDNIYTTDSGKVREYSLEDRILENYARNAINKPSIVVSQIHNAKQKNPINVLYKARIKSQEPLLLDFGNAEKYHESICSLMSPYKKAIYNKSYYKFLSECLDKGRVVCGSSIKDLKIEVYLTYFVDKHGRMYDDLGFVNLKSELKDALTPDYINYDIKSCYPTIIRQLLKREKIKCSFFDSDPKMYLYDLLHTNGIPGTYKQLETFIKTINLRFQFKPCKINPKSKVFNESPFEYEVNKFICDLLNKDTRYKSLRRALRRLWTTYKAPRRLNLDKNDYKSIATYTLQGIEANLIDVLLLNMTQEQLDFIRNAPVRSNPTLTFNNVPWSSIEHDGVRIRKIYKLAKTSLSIDGIEAEITSKISNDTPIPNHALPPLPQIPNNGNPNVHNYVLSELPTLGKFSRGRGLARLGTRLLH